MGKYEHKITDLGFRINCIFLHKKAIWNDILHQFMKEKTSKCHVLQKLYIASTHWRKILIYWLWIQNLSMLFWNQPNHYILVFINVTIIVYCVEKCTNQCKIHLNMYFPFKNFMYRLLVKSLFCFWNWAVDTDSLRHIERTGYTSEGFS